MARWAQPNRGWAYAVDRATTIVVRHKDVSTGESSSGRNFRSFLMGFLTRIRAEAAEPVSKRPGGVFGFC